MNHILKCYHIVTAFMQAEKVCKFVFLKWDAIKNLQQALKPLYQATVLMQTADFTMSDFYASWMQMENCLEKIIKKASDKRPAESLLDSVKKRKSQLFENKAMVCALALDPRFCGAIEGDSRRLAVDCLVNLWKRIRAFHGSNESNSNHSSSEDEISVESTRALEYYMKKKTKSTNIFATNIFEISEKVLKFIETKHDNATGTIFQFWTENNKKYPELFEMSQIVFAICPTQAIVERAFSALSHIFPPKRSQLKEELLEDILTISLNSDIFALVNEENLQAIVEEN